VIALALCFVGGWFVPGQFFYSYLMAYFFWLGIPLGCLGIMMLHNLTHGAWGVLIRRLLEAGMRTLPLMLLLFVPVIFGMHTLYEWARPEAMAEDVVLQQKSAYLNVPFFLIRAAIYFALWIFGASLLTRWSREHDRTGDPRLLDRLRSLSAPGLILYAFTITFASIDWLMSLEPHWYSTIFGVHFMGSHALSALALTIAITGLLRSQEPLAGVLQPSYLHDLGNLLLGFVMLWAYFTLSQWLIVWSGNIAEEVTWYVHRSRGGWQWVATALVIFHFFLPFFMLLLRSVKRRAETLSALAMLVVFMRLVDVFWYTAPAFHPANFQVHWMDLLATIGLGGIWIAVFIWQLRPVPLLPLQEPLIKEALARG
jgi:hypothetical protein